MKEAIERQPSFLTRAARIIKENPTPVYWGTLAVANGIAAGLGFTSVIKMPDWMPALNTFGSASSGAETVITLTRKLRRRSS